MCVCLFQGITWSLFQSKLRRPLLMDERMKCKPWSAIRKFRSPKQNTTLCVRGMEPHFTCYNNPHCIFFSLCVCARAGILTCGPGYLGCQRCRSLVPPGCTQAHQHAAERSSCELLGGSWGSTPCGHRRKNAQTLLLYYPDTDKHRRRNTECKVKVKRISKDSHNEV